MVKKMQFHPINLPSKKPVPHILIPQKVRLPYLGVVFLSVRRVRLG